MTADDVDYARPAVAVSVFVAAGWTPEQWNDLYRFLTTRREDGAYELAEWLQYPPRFVTAPTPATVRDVFARHGKAATQVLTAVAAGATERFAVAFLGTDVGDGYSLAIAHGWSNACRLGLTEPQAVGWATTGYLYSRHQLSLDGPDREPGQRPGTNGTLTPWRRCPWSA